MPTSTCTAEITYRLPPQDEATVDLAAKNTIVPDLTAPLAACVRLKTKKQNKKIYIYLTALASTHSSRMADMYHRLFTIQLLYFGERVYNFKANHLFAVEPLVARA